MSLVGNKCLDFDMRIGPRIDVSFQIICQFYRDALAAIFKFSLVHHLISRSYKAFKNDFLFEKVLTGYLAGIVEEFSKGKPTLVFCRQELRTRLMDLITYVVTFTLSS